MPNHRRPSRALHLGVLAVGLAAGCGDTVDFIEAVPRPDPDQGQSSTSETTEAPTDTGADTSTSGATATVAETEAEAETATETGSEVASCTQLDLLLVVDNTELDALVLEAVLQRVGSLEELLLDASRPWAEDFHVGVVPTQDMGPLSECRVSGALSTQPGGAGEPCPTTSGQPWASAGEADLGGMLECLGDLEITTDQVRRVAEASGRGLGSPVPGDRHGHDVAAACNAGFHRPDALTVLVLITSDDDLGSPGDASTWSEAVAASAHAPEIVIAMLPESEAGDGCRGPATRLMDWLYYEMNATVLDWCAPSPADAVDSLVTELEQRLDSHCAT